MPELPLYLANEAYSPTMFRRITAALYPLAGVIGPASFKITAGGTADLTYAAGQAVIHPRGSTSTLIQSAYLVTDTAGGTITVPSAPTVNPRYDVVILTVRDSEVSGSDDDAIIQIISGSEAASPTAPSLPDRSLALATVLRAVGDNTIVTADLVDTRPWLRPGGVAYRVKTALTERLSTTFSEDNELQIYIPHFYGSNIKIDFVGLGAGSTGADIAFKFQFFGTSGTFVTPSITGTGPGLTQTATEGSWSVTGSINGSSGDDTTTVVLGTLNTPGLYTAVGFGGVTGLADDSVTQRVSLSWAQNVATGVSSLYEGSEMRITVL